MDVVSIESSQMIVCAMKCIIFFVEEVRTHLLI